jgi:hypothetical protein
MNQHFLLVFSFISSGLGLIVNLVKYFCFHFYQLSNQYIKRQQECK